MKYEKTEDFKDLRKMSRRPVYNLNTILLLENAKCWEA
jgi:hypothetical protein